jgi:hypothetical protein
VSVPANILAPCKISVMAIHRKYDIIPILTNVAQAAVKEKVIRVVVATFRVSDHVLDCYE